MKKILAGALWKTLFRRRFQGKKGLRKKNMRAEERAGIASMFLTQPSLMEPDGVDAFDFQGDFALFWNVDRPAVLPSSPNDPNVTRTSGPFTMLCNTEELPIVMGGHSDSPKQIIEASGDVQIVNAILCHCCRCGCRLHLFLPNYAELFCHISSNVHHTSHSLAFLAF